jgi:hypothetical protein
MQSRFPLWFRIGSLIALVMLFVIALLSFLNYANFRKTLHGLAETRYTVLGKDSRQTVESGLALGLLPDQNAQLAADFAKLTSRWPAIRFAGVVATDGRLLVGSGTPMAASRWQSHIADSPLDGLWRSRGDHEDAVGLNIENNFGDKAGAVVIAYDDRETRAASSIMAQQLVWRALAVALLSTVAAWFGAWWFTRALADELGTAAALLAADADAAADNADSRPLVAGIRGFLADLRRADASLPREAP